ncbi:DUF2628 domain-containing protein [Burkholderia stagnalis]
MSEVTTTASSSPTAHDDELAAYVGKDAAWFEKKWAIAASRKSRISWNWSACFLGPVWMAYRRMYWQAAAVLGASLGISWIELLYFPTLFESSMLDPITVAIAVSLGWYANGLYKAHVERSIDRLRPSVTSGESLLALLQARGGTNWLAAAGFAIATPLLVYLPIALRDMAVALR